MSAEEKNEAVIRRWWDEPWDHPPTFSYRSLGQLVDLGESSALVAILGAKVSGLVGSPIWKGVYLYELGYDLNRAQLLANWTIDLFARPDTSKLFDDNRHSQQ